MDDNHIMELESVEVVAKEIHLKNRSLVGTNRTVLEQPMSEYICSCGERFDTGRDARDHLLSVRSATPNLQGGDGDA